jgi:hypothetical protein
MDREIEYAFDADEPMAGRAPRHGCYGFRMVMAA